MLSNGHGSSFDRSSRAMPQRLLIFTITFRRPAFTIASLARIPI